MALEVIEVKEHLQVTILRYTYQSSLSTYHPRQHLLQYLTRGNSRFYHVLLRAQRADNSRESYSQFSLYSIFLP